MFGRLVEELEEVLAGFEPSSLLLSEVEPAWMALDRLERLAAGAKLRLAGRMEEADGWRRAGRRSAADHLALLSGTSVAAARGQLEASRRLAGLPVVADALAAGELSAAQAQVVVDASAAAPGSQGELVAAAGRESMSELRDRCGRVKAAADRDAEARHRRIHAGRFLRRRPCPDGAAELVYRSTPDEVADVLTVAQAFADRLFRRAHRAGTGVGVPVEAHLADGLLAAARRAASTDGQAVEVGRGEHATETDAARGSPVDGDQLGRVVPKEVIVRIDWDALLRGWPEEGEVCEIPGVGSVPVSAVRTMLASGDAALKAVVTRGVDVVAVAHVGRKPTAHQKTALRWLDLVCDEEGCGQRAFLEIDHTIPWTTSRITLLQLLQPKCRHHHRAKTRADMAALAAGRERAGPAP